MKRVLSLIGIFTAAFIFLSSFSLRENPQDPPRGKKKHIKMVKVVDGEKIELDTLLEGDEPFVWMGDTVGHKMKWISSDNMEFGDSLKEYKFDIRMSDDEKGENVFIMKSTSGDKEHAPHMMWFSDDSDISMPIGAHNTKVVRKKIRGNVIDLSDPGIISFKKKKLSGGREKIEIIRNEVEENFEEDINVFIDAPDKLHMIHADSPHIEKRIKVISDDSGLIQILEDGDLKKFEFKGLEEGVHEFKEDGKIIRIKKMKKGDGKEIEVNVEVEEEIEKEDANLKE